MVHFAHATPLCYVGNFRHQKLSTLNQILDPHLISMAMVKPAHKGRKGAPPGKCITLQAPYALKEILSGYALNRQLKRSGQNRIRMLLIQY